MTNSALRLRTADGVRAALDALSNGHPVTRVDGGREPVWRIAPEDEHEAAFYRNSLIRRVPGDLDRRAGARPRRAAPNATGWKRSGRRRCGCATC